MRPLPSRVAALRSGSGARPERVWAGRAKGWSAGPSADAGVALAALISPTGVATCRELIRGTAGRRLSAARPATALPGPPRKRRCPRLVGAPRRPDRQGPGRRMSGPHACASQASCVRQLPPRHGIPGAGRSGHAASGSLFRSLRSPTLGWRPASGRSSRAPTFSAHGPQAALARRWRPAILASLRRRRTASRGPSGYALQQVPRRRRRKARLGHWSWRGSSSELATSRHRRPRPWTPPPQRLSSRPTFGLGLPPSVRLDDHRPSAPILRGSAPIMTAGSSALGKSRAPPIPVRPLTPSSTTALAARGSPSGKGRSAHRHRPAPSNPRNV